MILYLCGHLAVIDPSQCCEVGGFCAVKAVVESGVIAVWERDHKLALFLSDLQENKPIISQNQTSLQQNINFQTQGIMFYYFI